MRPPEHWHLRQRPDRSGLWWALGLIALVIVGVLLVRPRLSGGDAGPAEVSAGCAASAAGAGCPTPLSSEVLPAVPGSWFAGEVAPPKITGRTAAVIELSCGALLYAEDAHQRLAPASLTKIATALVAVEQTPLSEMVTVRVNSALLASSSGSSVMGLKPGQRLSMRDLLYGLILPSGNDAGIAIAEHVAGSVPAFAEMMNDKVDELGLVNTRFANPHGLDDLDHYTTAYDMAMLGRALLAQPALAEIVATDTYQPAWDGPQLWNGNKLLYNYSGTLGVKTGYTADAGQTIVAAAERDGRRLIVSVLGAWDHYSDATMLLEWAFANTSPACEEPAPAQT
ncbi:MAG: D-alanyl-D-alanine carboxypeptidase [Chloroflexi bacterium]|nr:D-alanyl-D-alanine carboxypeptidase [Chloroflexota bacterium]